MSLHVERSSQLRCESSLVRTAFQPEQLPRSRTECVWVNPTGWMWNSKNCFSLGLLAWIFGCRNKCHRVPITCSESELVFRFLIGCHHSQRKLDFAASGSYLSKCTCMQGHLKLAWSLNRIMRTENRQLTRNVGKKKLPSCKVIFFSDLGPIP